MRILVLPVGSHGDVHPLLGISLALRARGHDVTVATNEHFEPLVRSANLPFLPTGTDADFRAALADPNLWHPLRGFKTVMEKGIVPVMRRTYELIRQHFPDPNNTIIVAAGIAFGARVAQDKHGYRVATLQLQPAVFRSVHANPKLPGMFMPQGMPKFLKHLIWSLADVAMVEPVCRPPINAFRREVGLPPVKGILKEWWNSPTLTLALFPDWFAPPQPDWPPQARLTGFPLYDEEGLTPLPPDLLEFLSAHPRPIAFTPGSANLHAEDFFAESALACAFLDRPGLLLTRHADQIPQNLPTTVKHVPYAPFSQLLPHCSALVHHGGIGTTAQALRAGRPQLIMPLSHDQFDNAARARRLGVADTLSPRRYRAPAVAEKLRALLDSPATATSCRAVAARFEGTDAIAAACDQIEELGRQPSASITPAANPERPNDGLFVAPFIVDGELEGVAFQGAQTLSSKWLSICTEQLSRQGPSFNAAWAGNLAHIRTKFTSAEGAALVTFYVHDRIALSALMATGVSPAAETEVMNMFIASMRQVDLVRAAAVSPKPFEKLLGLKERPLFAVLPWPDQLISANDHELVRVLGLHLAIAFFQSTSATRDGAKSNA